MYQSLVFVFLLKEDCNGLEAWRRDVSRNAGEVGGEVEMVSKGRDRSDSSCKMVQTVCCVGFEELMHS